MAGGGANFHFGFLLLIFVVSHVVSFSYLDLTCETEGRKRRHATMEMSREKDLEKRRRGGRHPLLLPAAKPTGHRTVRGVVVVVVVVVGGGLL